MQINVYAKKDKMEASEIKAIGKAVMEAGFGIGSLKRNSTGCQVTVIGAYYGMAVEAINDLGYKTDEDETEDVE